MPEILGMLMTIKKDDKISGSSQLARAVWALGRLGAHASPAEIARTIRARTPLNWEGSQAAKFFRNARRSTSDGHWFTRILGPQGGPGRPRYLYDLTEQGRVYFRKTWTEGDWKPGGPEERKRHGERGIRIANPPEDPPAVIRDLRRQIETLTDQVRDQRRLLKRINTCHHSHVERVMSDISDHLKKGEK